MLGTLLGVTQQVKIWKDLSLIDGSAPGAGAAAAAADAGAAAASAAGPSAADAAGPSAAAAAAAAQ